jgi:hypothetical protein
MTIIYIKYDGNNLKLLSNIKNLFPDSDNFLFRTSELSELRRVIKYGTDRGGYPFRLWEDGITPFEDVIFGTTTQMIIDAENDDKKSSSFKKIPLIQQTDIPIILIYDLNEFEMIADRQWKFKNSKIDSLKYIIFI